LDDAALFFFNDNSTVEGALFTGNSSSKTLFNLVMKLRKFQFKTGISGKRMISQGTYGVSRGTLGERVAAEADMLQYVPLHLSEIQQNPH
jgi:hypothetical protein